MERIKYLSNSTVSTLRQNITINAKRYLESNFLELMNEGEWSVELQLSADLSSLSKLDASGKPEAEVENSMLVWNSLNMLSPSLAYEEGIWVRLTHIECLSFSRTRWLRNVKDDHTLKRDVSIHFFADTLNRRRDDNAISRLWWNAYIAHDISPNDPRAALKFILNRADTRASLIERSLTGTRRAIMSGLIRVATVHPAIINNEFNFRSFMIMLNRLGGGQIFEAMPEQEIDKFLIDCAIKAQIEL